MLPIAFKAAVVIVMGLLGLYLLRARALERWSDATFLCAMAGIQLAAATVSFTLLYVVGHQEVTSDVPSFYVPAARGVLEGQVPFRDFSLSYAPLFPYVGAGILWIWNSGKAFALLDILVNLLTLVAWNAAALACTDRTAARQSTILFATSGHVLVQGLLGTNQAWVAASVGISALLLQRSRETTSGIVQAVALCTTKFLTLLLWPVLWICAPRRLRWVGGATVLAVIVYGAFTVTGASVLDPLRREGDLITSGNLPYLFGALNTGSHLHDRAIFDTVALLAVATSLAWLYLRSRRLMPPMRTALLPASIALIGLVFMLVSKKSATGYEVFFMYPAILVTMHEWRRPGLAGGFLVVFNLLLAVEPSLWFHLEGGANRPLWEWLQASNGAPSTLTFIALDVCLLACYAIVAYLSVRWAARLTREPCTSSLGIRAATA